MMSMMGSGGIDPVSMGVQFGLGTLDKLAQGENLGNATLESLPVVGGIFANKRATKERKEAEANQLATEQNANNRFADFQGSNIPMMYGGQIYMQDGGRMDLPEMAFNTFDTGGSHAQNPLGGIPMPNGKSVEEGESKFKFDDGDYVFSDTLTY